jgi:hypothetical protein
VAGWSRQHDRDRISNLDWQIDIEGWNGKPIGQNLQYGILLGNFASFQAASVLKHSYSITRAFQDPSGELNREELESTKTQLET